MPLTGCYLQLEPTVGDRARGSYPAAVHGSLRRAVAVNCDMTATLAVVDADELYGLPLDQFVPERGALAKALRSEGRGDESAEVAGLRKPSVAAWAVNQLVRTQGRAVAELWAAGDALRAAHTDAVAGGRDGSSLRAASESERAVVDALVSAARGLLTSEGHELSATIVERVSETLHAAARDDRARGAVRAGRLERELRQLGFGVSDDAGRAARRRTGKPTPKKAVAAKERERLATARAERERLAARKAAHAAEAKARRVMDRAARSVEIAQVRRERAARALGDADTALATAREEAEAAADAHRRAVDELESV